MDFIKKTIELARENVLEGGRPFACLVVKDNQIVAEGKNLVAQTHDPTAHAEIVAIQKASKILKTENFTGCTFYIMAHPCPMCLGAMYYCSPDKVVFITTREDYSKFYVDNRKYISFDGFYNEFSKRWDERKMPMEYHPDQESLKVYELWKEKNKLS